MSAATLCARVATGALTMLSASRCIGVHHLHQGRGHELRGGAREPRRDPAARDEQIFGGVGHDEGTADGQAVARGEEDVGRGGNHGGGGSSGDAGAEEPGERRVLEDGAAHVDAGDDAAKLAPLGDGPARAGALDDDVADVLGEVGASVDARDHPERGGGERHLGTLEELRGGREDRARERAPGAVPAAADTTARSTHMRKGATATEAVTPATKATEASATAGIAAFSSAVLCPMPPDTLPARLDIPAEILPGSNPGFLIPGGVFTRPRPGVSAARELPNAREPFDRTHASLAAVASRGPSQ